jgi:hypothetical protein
MLHRTDSLPGTSAPKGGFYRALTPSWRLGGRITLLERGAQLPQMPSGFAWRWIGPGGVSARPARAMAEGRDAAA